MNDNTRPISLMEMVNRLAADVPNAPDEVLKATIIQQLEVLSGNATLLAITLQELDRRGKSTPALRSIATLCTHLSLGNPGYMGITLSARATHLPSLFNDVLNSADPELRAVKSDQADEAPKPSPDANVINMFSDTRH